MSPVWVFLATSAFALGHSVLASLTVKAQARRWLGVRPADGLYRLAYNAVSVLTLLPVLAAAAGLPDGAPVWRLPDPVRWVTIPVQITALGALGLSLWRVDLPRFLGLRQAVRFLRGEPAPRDPPLLRTDGVHGWVRHPLYFFSLVILWLAPVMTPNGLALTTALTLYFWIGARFEERKLVREFGAAYRDHQRRVPMLLPWPRPRVR